MLGAERVSSTPHLTTACSVVAGGRHHAVTTDVSPTDFLKPGFRVDVMFYTTEDWSKIPGRVQWYTARLAGAAALVLGLGAVIVTKLLSMLPL